MKNALLILLMLLLPFQAIAAMERNFTHVLNGQQSEASFIKHFTQHADMVMHHDHDDDDGGSVPHDDAQKSARHLADFDHAFSFNVLFPAPVEVDLLSAERIAPAIRPDTFDDRTTLPLRRPPRALA